MNQIKESGKVNESKLSQISKFYDSVTNNISVNPTNNKPFFDEENFKQFYTGFSDKFMETENIIDNFISYENVRNMYTILFFIFYVLVFGLSIFAFLKRRSNWILAFSIILLFTLPFILLYTGLLGSYFFIYSDLCDSVYDAIYKNQIPIYGKGLGYLTSCYDIVRMF